MENQFSSTSFEAFNCFTESEFLNFGVRSQNVMWFLGNQAFYKKFNFGVCVVLRLILSFTFCLQFICVKKKIYDNLK